MPVRPDELMVVNRGRKGLPTYNTWRGMKARCFNKNRESWKDYGGRGISVCERWLLFENFLDDMGHCPTGMSIERVDNNGDYDPSNCVWATPQQQSENRRCNHFLTIQGETQCVTEWCRRTGVPRTIAYYRIKTGWTVEDAVFVPVGTKPGKRK